MSILSQIKHHSFCLCAACWQGKFNKVDFYLAGIKRALWLVNLEGFVNLIFLGLVLVAFGLIFFV